MVVYDWFICHSFIPEIPASHTPSYVKVPSAKGTTEMECLVGYQKDLVLLVVQRYH